MKWSFRSRAPLNNCWQALKWKTGTEEICSMRYSCHRVEPRGRNLDYCSRAAAVSPRSDAPAATSAVTYDKFMLILVLFTCKQHSFWHSVVAQIWFSSICRPKSHISKDALCKRRSEPDVYKWRSNQSRGVEENLLNRNSGVVKVLVPSSLDCALAAAARKMLNVWSRSSSFNSKPQLLCEEMQSGFLALWLLTRRGHSRQGGLSAAISKTAELVRRNGSENLFLSGVEQQDRFISAAQKPSVSI